MGLLQTEKRGGFGGIVPIRYPEDHIDIDYLFNSLFLKE